MALLLWTLLAACLPALCAGSDQISTTAVPPEDALLLQAGTEPGTQDALQGPTNVPPHFPDEAAGQGETVPDGSKGQEGLPNSPEGEEEGEEGCREPALSGSVGQVASAMRALGVDLLWEIEAEKGMGNAIFSPLSITLALAHLSLGAASQTEKHLQEVLHMDSVPYLHQALREVTKQLQRTALSIAGRLFLKKDFPFKETFLEASQRFYGAKPSLLSGNRFWKTKFNPQLTKPSLFYLDEKSAVSVEMMKGEDFPLSWFTIGSLETMVAKFPFKGNTSFVAIVPSLHQKNFSQVLSEVLQQNLKRSFPQARPTSVKMPKLHLEDHTELNGALTRLGLSELFSEPDLSRIAEGPLMVSSIQQRAALELNEDGVKAAAATTSMFTFISFSGFSLDQPFIFMIMENVLDIPLFLGIIRNPRPEKQVLAVNLPPFKIH